MNISLNVELHVSAVDPDDFDPDTIKLGDPLRDKVIGCVEEAVMGALQYAEGDGYRHELEDQISIQVETVDAGSSSLALLEELLALTERFKDQMDSGERKAWERISAAQADIACGDAP